MNSSADDVRIRNKKKQQQKSTIQEFSTKKSEGKFE